LVKFESNVLDLESNTFVSGLGPRVWVAEESSDQEIGFWHQSESLECIAFCNSNDLGNVIEVG
jgi:hypothetical protein